MESQPRLRFQRSSQVKETIYFSVIIGEDFSQFLGFRNCIEFYGFTQFLY
jgi:hypothetical protein